MIFLRSLVFNILYASWAMISAIIFAPLFLISSDASQKAGAPWAHGVLFLARIICGIRYDVRGREYISNKPVIYASKHQSAWDTVIFLTLLPHPAYVLKRSLLKIPLWGWYLWRMKMIAIDRSGKASSLKQMVKDAKETLANGRSIVIYPEGTRTRPGAEPLYHPGIIAMYNQLDVSVVPVALNSGLLWGRDAFIKRPGTITIEFLPPIPSGIDKKQFANTLQNTIESATSRLIANP